ncbi:hypothetical protein BCR35DRAFT_301239 [Leucosporidium creatinivorum]|uniref:MYND-type domain-containing protein n=1 Tax=Leucosporidium creatinivorum TaxID=106004 RepID=A0A1Y2FZT7_9BASI|nr:hypothetical protein BCR35DRAFT_301239 [Leucosporidium creatinivorum]
MSPEPLCFVCSSPAATRCSRCKDCFYCSSSCQTKDWICGHKMNCIKPEDRAPPRPATSKNKEQEEEKENGDEESIWQIAGPLNRNGFRQEALTDAQHFAAQFYSSVLSSGNVDRLDGMDIGPDGVSSFSLEALRYTDSNSKRLDTVFAIARLYWRGTVASLNAQGQEQLRARLRLCLPYGEFKGFTGEEVKEPSKVSNKTLDALFGMLPPHIMGLVDDKVVKLWSQLAVIKMKVQGASGGSGRMR